jgi:hypothetical protein
VEKVLKPDEEEKIELISCFEAATLKSRYFKRILPGKGEQPEALMACPLFMLKRGNRGLST